MGGKGSYGGLRYFKLLEAVLPMAFPADLNMDRNTLLLCLAHSSGSLQATGRRPAPCAPRHETPSRPGGTRSPQGERVVRSVFFYKRWLIKWGLNYPDSHILA